jgi:hypothetical protein
MCTSVSRSRGARQACGGACRGASRFVVWFVARGVSGLSRGAMSARRPRQGEALPMTQCVVSARFVSRFVARGDECAAATPRRGYRWHNVLCRLGSCRGLSRGAMSARRPRQGEALPMVQCVVRQINASPGRRTHEPCVPTFWRLFGGGGYDLVIAVCCFDCFVIG